MTSIAMIGCGKLGRACAEVMSEKHTVVGYDVANIENCTFPMMPSIRDAVLERDIIFIAVPTPHDPNYGGELPTSHLPPRDFDYTVVCDVLHEINQYATSNQLVVLVSTVLPGTVRSILKPLITNARFVYNPYLIAMGTVKEDMVHPEMVIIGTEDGTRTQEAEILIAFYDTLMRETPRYVIGTWDEAECIKIFYNTFISAKIALVNMMQDVAESNGNIKVDVVTDALAHSTQRIISPAYMKSGMGDGGACHPRDNIALQTLSKNLGLGYDLFGAIMQSREVQAERLAKKCLEYGKNITILGKSYKPGVPYTDGSYSLLVAHFIMQHGGKVNFYDPLCGEMDLRTDWAHAYLMADPTFDINLTPGYSVVIDPWRVHDRNTPREIVAYGDTRNYQDRFVHDDDQLSYMRNEFFFKNVPEAASKANEVWYTTAYPSLPDFFTRCTATIIKDILKAHQQGKRYFVFDNSGEAICFTSLEKITRISNMVKDTIPPERFYYITASLDAENQYIDNKLAAHCNRQIKILVVSALEAVVTRFLNDPANAELLSPYQIKLRRKKYLCLNRMPREHRIRLLDQLWAKNLVEDALYSFGGGGDENWLLCLPDDCTDVRARVHMFPLTLDQYKDNEPQIKLSNMPYHDDSYFSVVTETRFYQFHRNSGLPLLFGTTVCPSEKIFRAIAMKHPFISVAVPGYLAALRNKGYQTFAPFIDETYDTIQDDNERLTAIVHEIERLCAFSDDQWLEWQENIRSIVEHNQRHLKCGSNLNATINMQDKFI